MPKKKRRKPYDGDPVMVTKRATWGTKAQGKINERERGYKNRIHELEQMLNKCAEEMTALAAQRDRLERNLGSASPARYLAALRKVCLISLRDSVDLGLMDEIGQLCVWLSEIERGSEAEPR